MAESESLVRLQKRDGIAEVTLNRPAKRNALTRELIRQLAAVVDDVAADSAQRILVLAAEGPVFCAGMDLDEMQSRVRLPHAREEWETDARDYRDLLLAIFKLDLPTLAVVQGPAVAGGFGLVLACDLMLASTNGSFALPETKRGISPAVVSPLLLYRAGVGAAAPVLLAGESITAEQAVRLNLCHHLVAPAELDAARARVCHNILQGAPGATAMTKRLARSFAIDSLEKQLAAGLQVSAEARQSDEAREGLAAFLEKRSPSWSPMAE